MTYPHIDQNGISGKSVKNAPTSRPHNFFKNGRMKLVYDSFWSQEPPKLQKTGLGWVPQLARPRRVDLRFFSIFRKFRSGPRILKNRFFGLLSPKKNVRKWIVFKFCNFPKNYDTSAPFLYIYIGRTPNRSKITILGNPIVHFSKVMCISLFWKPLNCICKKTNFCPHLTFS